MLVVHNLLLLMILLVVHAHLAIMANISPSV